MIHDKDRSGWIGASDTSFVMGNWNTATWAKWWAEKLGIRSNHFETIYTKTGTWYEGKVLDALEVKKRDRQILIPRYRLRVNLDGETRMIHEVKTHKDPDFRVSKAYWQQAQVEMFAAKKPLEIVAYHLEAEDYLNWFRPVDMARLTHHPIPYDTEWIGCQYLPRLMQLSECLKKGGWP